MKIISWNLNGLMSCVEHGSFQPIEQMSPDIVCLQEIRTEQEPEVIRGYHHYWNHAKRLGYAGTVTLSKEQPSNVIFGVGDSDLDADGRVITLEYPDYYVVNTYAPMSQRDLTRHEFRMAWDDAYREFVFDLALDEKPVILCGDFNVCRLDIDVYPENMRQYFSRKGYVSDEAGNLELILENGFVDAFRYLYPDKTGDYTWWSNRLNKREQDRGWRLDYFFVPENLADDGRIVDVTHHHDVMGSDHCPIELVLDT